MTVMLALSVRPSTTDGNQSARVVFLSMGASRSGAVFLLVVSAGRPNDLTIPHTPVFELDKLPLATDGISV